MHSSTRSTTRARFAALTLLGALVVGGPLSARAADLTRAAKGNPMRGDDVAARIKTLHNQLHITPEQEPAWNNVAQVMRDNAKTMTELRRQKTEGEGTNAIAALNAYASTIDAHADAIHKFIPAFQTLYDSLSGAQKKTADTVFRNRARAAAERRKR